ncbi:MAG: hypothetical protein JRN26_04700 [Nitrososphaerota archaeon]|nr:hypothetical protein [Nitrososphaerota archaeon]MDG6936164.1 hypothetical protein [Nitrososphaerota archaeon]MDG6944066.1 hypothetical protein [Nitrososphaerota archaeon]
MPREGYISINVREVDAEKARQEAQKLGITLVEYFNRLIDEAQTETIIRQGILKGILLQLSDNINAAYEIIGYLNKETADYMNKMAGKDAGDQQSFLSKNAAILQITNDLMQNAIQPMQLVLLPILGAMFSDKPELVNKLFGEKAKDKPLKYYSISDLKQTLSEMVVVETKLKDIFHDNVEVQRLNQALKPYLDEMSRIINLINNASV